MDKDTLCYSCLGCNRLEDDLFNGVRRCDYFANVLNKPIDIIKEMKNKL